MREVVISETPEDVADAAADLIFESQTEAIGQRGVFRIALSGGKTPRILYKTLASEEWRDRMAWENWQIFWSDERAVPPDHPESNYRLAYDALISKIPAGDVWRMRGEADNPTEAADEYARILRACFSGSIEFDTILLGMGSDGHTASLFPGHSALESTAVVEAVETDQRIPVRLTLTLPILNSARQIIFMVCGEEKSMPAFEVLSLDDSPLPAARVNPPDGACWWLLDQAAASKIR
jgi:6-phosphogluconolactonase